MEEIHKNPVIEWRKINDKECLFFIFKGTLTQLQAKNAVGEWNNLFESNNDRKIVLVWHCLEMAGYEPAARMIWQDTIKKHKKQIASIWLVANSTLIMAGAKIISLFTSFDIKVVRSEKLLKF